MKKKTIKDKTVLPMHCDLYIEVYRLRFLFLVDDNLARGFNWIDKTLDVELDRSNAIVESVCVAAAFGIPYNGGNNRCFVVWMKFWDHDAYSIARLSHECLHAAIHILSYVGYRPKLRPRFSEPICYLQDTLMRMCLEKILLFLALLSWPLRVLALAAGVGGQLD